MSTVIPSSLDEFLPSPVKAAAVVIENTSDLFFVFSQVESDQALPEYLIIRPDLIKFFDRVLRTLERYSTTEIVLVEDNGVTVDGLDMHWVVLTLNEFLDKAAEEITTKNDHSSATNITDNVENEQGHDDERDNTTEQF